MENEIIVNIKPQKNTFKERMIEKIKNMRANFAQLPASKKLILVTIIASILVLLIGTLYIILASIINLDTKSQQNNRSEIIKELEEIQSDINKNNEEFSDDTLQKGIDDIDSNFDNYESEMQNLEKKLNGFKSPLSAPQPTTVQN